MTRTPPEKPVRVAILGSTGSIGRSALDILSHHRGRYEVVGLAANRSVGRLVEQAAAFGVPHVAVADEGAFAER